MIKAVMIKVIFYISVAATEEDDELKELEMWAS